MQNIFKCTFLNVGTGDSIILEWIKDSKKKIAIIDCNNHKVKNRRNPVNEYLDYFDFEEQAEIDFVILTHPHVDHFSGFIDLFQYCKEKEIKIRKIYHTLTYCKEYLLSRGIDIDTNNEYKEMLKEVALPVSGLANEVGSYRNKLDNLIKQIQKGKEPKGKESKGKDIKRRTFEFPIEDDEDRPIFLNDELKLNILAPSYDDIFSFIKNPKEFADCGVSCVHNLSDGNILSTVFAIEAKNWYVLLTSDVKKHVFQRVLQDERFSSVFGKDVELFQVPHHGSIHSHIPEFWKSNNHKSTTAAVISVGDNNYGLPHMDVKNYYEKKGLRLYTTEKGTKILYMVLKNDCLIDATDLTRKGTSENYQYTVAPDGTNLYFLFNENGLVPGSPYKNRKL